MKNESREAFSDMKQGREPIRKNLIAAPALLVLVVLGFLAQRAVPFMMDDEWYGTNLVTGQPLAGFGDVVESQIWHFHNWGGRCMTHGALQLTLMLGELGADVLNLAMALLLTLLVCVLLRRRSLRGFLLVHSMIYALNANLKMSMLWQAGTVNYVYSSVWILLFLLPYLRLLEERPGEMPWGGNKQPEWVTALWLTPIGLLAGWSNENMGPSCFLLAVFAIVYVRRYGRKPVQCWMLTGMLSSLAGSILVVAAPGNFVRSRLVEEQTFFDRFYSMLSAGADFLLPSVLLAAVLLLIRLVCFKQRVGCMQWTLLGLAVISYGAMVLSPHYPDRATFGTMIMLIAFSCSLLWDEKLPGRLRESAETALGVCFFLAAAGRLIMEILFL